MREEFVRELGFEFVLVFDSFCLYGLLGVSRTGWTFVCLGPFLCIDYFPILVFEACFSELCVCFHLAFKSVLWGIPWSDR